ncbi:unnamed protein product [Gongylonema pulchrum]|uniref:GLOBIN domain-containing protein n=1 Tax=Gongylonema pulchrum TaxID=637853 RepID=A0A183DEL0_9BILA|nr:unnamed protein product [Gongylonema pulchrum]
MEIAPVVFRYGQRHYNGNAREYFNEGTVRLFCSQVVCTIADLLEVEVDPVCIEAWIEMMRYVGSKLLDGFNYERMRQKKLTVNTSDHPFYML